MIKFKLRRFVEDTRASMATQVVVFSVVLFAMSGVVLDFGRVYSEHSSMQSYTDQAALAAAAELDQTAGAIQRAIDTVYGNPTAGITPISKSAVFSKGETDAFEISHLLFLRDLANDDGRQYEMGSDLSGDNVVYAAFANGGVAGGDIEAASIDARFVVAVAEERSVRNSLMRLINATGTESVRETQVLRTVAAAQGRRLTCGVFADYSSFVVCDPWSIDAGGSFPDVMSETVNGAAQTANAGRQFRLTADGTLQGLDKIHRLQEYSVGDNARALCDDPSRLPGVTGGSGAAEIAFARSICYLAASEPVTGERCIIDGAVSVVPLSGEEITTALNVAFNMWDEPIAEVLDWRTDPTLAADSALFQPDINILKGKTWHHGRAQVNAARGVPMGSRLNYAEADEHGAIDIDLKWSCLNPIQGAGVDAECVTYSDNAVIDFVGDVPTATEHFEYFATNLPLPYLFTINSVLNANAASGQGTTYEEIYRLLRQIGLNTLISIPLPDGAVIPAGGSHANFHPADATLLPDTDPLDIDIADIHQVAEDASLLTTIGGVPQVQQSLMFEPDGVTQTDQINEFVRLPDGAVDVRRDGNGDPLPPEPGQDGFQDVMATPLEAGFNYSPIDTSLFPRVFDVTVVNCSAMSQEVNAETGETENRAPVVGFAQMFLMHPPDPTCGTGGAPWEVGGPEDVCLNANITSADIYLEYTGFSTTTDDSYSVLVR